MLWKKNWLLFFVLLLLGGSGCSPDNLFAPKPYQETQFLLDTVIEITAYGPEAETAVQVAFAECKRMHDITNLFDENSQVAQVNRSAGREKVKVDPDIIKMIQRANQLSDKLDGSFDVTIGALSNLWGIGRKGDYVPEQADIDSARALVNYRLLAVDEEHSTLFLPKAGMMLDLGGIAKGYIVDKMIAVLKEHGVTSALLNAGGDVRVIGRKPDGKPWRIGVQDPRHSEGIAAKLALTEWDTMETSGDYQRFFVKDGVRYSHILDPHTGRQPNAVASVTIINNSSTDGDILTTAVFVLGVDKGRELLAQFPGNEAFIVATDGKTYLTPGLQGKMELGLSQ